MGQNKNGEGDLPQEIGAKHGEDATGSGLPVLMTRSKICKGRVYNVESATVETFRSARYTANLWQEKERNEEGGGAGPSSSPTRRATKSSSSSETEELYKTRRGRRVPRINYKASKAKKKKR